MAFDESFMVIDFSFGLSGVAELMASFPTNIARRYHFEQCTRGAILQEDVADVSVSLGLLNNFIFSTWWVRSMMFMVLGFSFGMEIKVTLKHWM